MGHQQEPYPVEIWKAVRGGAVPFGMGIVNRWATFEILSGCLRNAGDTGRQGY